MMKTFTIRRYQSGDYDAVWKLHIAGVKQVAPSAEIGKNNPDLDDIEGIYMTKGGEFLVGTIRGHVVAMGGVKATDRYRVARMVYLRVHPAYQGEGFGHQILTSLEKVAKDLGYGTMELDTWTINSKAQRFYERNGYRRISESVADSFPSFRYQKDLDSQVTKG